MMRYLSKETEEMKRIREEYTERILNDEDIKALIQKHGINEPIKYLADFNRFISIRDSDKDFYPTFSMINGYAEVGVAYRDKDKEHRNKDRVNQSLVLDRNNERLRGLMFNDLTIDKDNAPFIQAFKAWANDYSYKGGKKGVWLSGSYGIGKTYLLGAFANEINKKGAGVYMTSLESLLDDQKESFNYKTAIEPIERAKRAEVLILDDVATEYHTDWAHGQIYDLLNHRMNNEQPTFFTSNMTIEEYAKEIAKKAGSVPANRLKARINYLANDKTVVMGGENKR